MTNKFKITLAVFILVSILLVAYMFAFEGTYTSKVQGTAQVACAAGDFNFEGTNILTGSLASISLLVVFHISLKLADKKDKRNRQKFNATCPQTAYEAIKGL